MHKLLFFILKKHFQVKHMLVSMVRAIQSLGLPLAPPKCSPIEQSLLQASCPQALLLNPPEWLGVRTFQGMVHSLTLT